ncbi:MAG: lipid II flippase MurJ, partial [Armatimonadia bacterium]
MPEPTPQSPSAATAATRGLAAAAALMVITTFGSRLTGMVRMMVLTHIFGATGEVNAFFQAFAIPDFVYFLIAGGALRTGFVPIFTEYITLGKYEQAWKTFSSTFWTLLIGAGMLICAAMALAPQLTVLVAPGWAQTNPELMDPCTRMMRILFPAQIFFMLGGLMQGALNARKHFLWPGLGPIIYNLAIIAGAIAAPHLVAAENVRRAAAGLPPSSGVVYVTYFVLIGAVIGNVLVQIPPLRAVGAKLAVRLDLHDEGMTRVFKLALPVIFGLAIGEINWMIVRVLCTHFPGGPAILETSNRLWKLPSGIFAAGIAIAIFPSLAEHY